METQQEKQETVLKVKLTDEDINKLASVIVEKSAEQFQMQLGKAVLAAVWKVLLGAGALLYLWTTKK